MQLVNKSGMIGSDYAYELYVDLQGVKRHGLFTGLGVEVESVWSGDHSPLFNIWVNLILLKVCFEFYNVNHEEY